MYSRLERVETAIDRLAPRTRQVFLMHRMENLPYGEIAHRLGISQGAVGKQVSNALAFLANWTQDRQ